MAGHILEILDSHGSIVGMVEVGGGKTIGRGMPGYEPDIVIPPEYRSAGRTHAEVELVDDVLMLHDRSQNGTIIIRSNGDVQIVLKGSSAALANGDELIFGTQFDGWHVRLGVSGTGEPTDCTDSLEKLTVTNNPREIRVGDYVLEGETLGRRPFQLLEFLCCHKGQWYTTEDLIDKLWEDTSPELWPERPIEALSRYKKEINDFLIPHINETYPVERQPPIVSWPHKGYRMKPRLDES